MNIKLNTFSANALSDYCAYKKSEWLFVCKNKRKYTSLQEVRKSQARESNLSASGSVCYRLMEAGGGVHVWKTVELAFSVHKESLSMFSSYIGSWGTNWSKEGWCEWREFGTGNTGNKWKGKCVSEWYGQKYVYWITGA